VAGLKAGATAIPREVAGLKAGAIAIPREWPA
jgi:hypothetical protein